MKIRLEVVIAAIAVSMACGVTPHLYAQTCPDLTLDPTSTRLQVSDLADQ